MRAVFVSAVIRRFIRQLSDIFATTDAGTHYAAVRSGRKFHMIEGTETPAGVVPDSTSEMVVIEELDGKVVVSARLVSDAAGDHLVLGLANNRTLIIRPHREGDRDFLHLEFPEAS
jgi:hypothetical protein